jgi:MinD-like ATPase involved in chromosome partitioning or flagellar assembly
VKIAVLNFSGNVGKTTISRHLLKPNLPACELVSVETANADEGEADALKGQQFAQLQQFMLTVDNVIVDIGASNIEELLRLMTKYKGSHEDFDLYLIPTVPDKKQQRDTVSTVKKLIEMGVKANRIKLILNRVESYGNSLFAFDELLQAVNTYQPAIIDARWAIAENALYQEIKHDSRSITELASDSTDFKDLIAKAKTTDEKIVFADKLAIKRLAQGIAPELQACFVALELT